MIDHTGFSRFFLYGEPPRRAASRFLHLESLGDRSGPANWRIGAHAHGDLLHVILIESGGGVAEADGMPVALTAPCILVVPAGVVHSFDWASGTDGRVLTLSDAFLRTIATREPLLAQMFGRGFWTASTAGVDIAGPLSALARELSWVAAGSQLALEARLSLVLVEVLRLREQIDEEQVAAPGQQALLLARFRELAEAHFREHPTVEWCAAELGVSPGRLRAACRDVANISPIRLLQERLIVEAERVLRYSDMTVTQVAHYLGFGDAAYFSRFFSHQTGASPRAFRIRARRRLAAA